MGNTLDVVQQEYVKDLSKIVEKENVSMNEAVKKVTNAALNKNRLPLICLNNSIKNFDEWLEVTGFHYKIWETEYEQALNVLFHSK